MTTSTRPDGALNRELRAIVEGAGLPEEIAQTIARANAQIEQSGEACGLAVEELSPQAPEKSAGLVQQHHLTLDVLSDLDGAVAREWKLRFTLSDEIISTLDALARDGR